MNQNTGSEEEKLLMENSLTFFGAITASVSHELNNVISIINQTAGLLDDLLIGSREGRPIKTERLEKMAGSVKNQTDRGIDIIRRLNKFAHSTDEPVREYDPGDMIENLVSLTRRLADMKKVTLEMVPADGPVPVVGNPFQAQQAVFMAIRLALSTSLENDTIRIEMLEQEDVLKLLISGIRSDQGAEFDLSYLKLLTESFGGTITHRSEGEPTTLEITVPRGK